MVPSFEVLPVDKHQNNKITAKDGYARLKLLHPLVAIKETKCSFLEYLKNLIISLGPFPYCRHLFSLAFLSQKLSWIFWRIKIWVLLYLSTKFELDRFTNNRILSNRKTRKHKYKDKNTHTYTETETNTLPIYHLG